MYFVVFLEFGEYCVVYLHIREKNQLRDESTLRNKDVVSNDKYLNKFACVIDLVCNQRYNLYECTLNTDADVQLNRYTAIKGRVGK